MVNKILKNIELYIEDVFQHGVNAISLVNEPAIEQYFIALSKEEEVKLSTIDEERRIVIGPALIPNQYILRKDKETGEYYNIFFSEETIRETAKQFAINKNQSNSTLEHQIVLNGITVTESWIIEDSKADKSSIYGFNLPKGTWMLTSYVEDDVIWNMIKKGDIRGYSIEGSYSDKKTELSTEAEIELSEEELIKDIINLIDKIESKSK